MSSDMDRAVEEAEEAVRAVLEENGAQKSEWRPAERDAAYERAPTDADARRAARRRGEAVGDAIISTWLGKNT